MRCLTALQSLRLRRRDRKNLRFSKDLQGRRDRKGLRVRKAIPAPRGLKAISDIPVRKASKVLMVSKAIKDFQGRPEQKGCKVLPVLLGLRVRKVRKVRRDLLAAPGRKVQAGSKSP